MPLLDGITFLILGGQVLGHQQEHGSQKSLGTVVEKSVLPILGAVAAAGVDEGLGKDLGVFLRLGLCSEVIRLCFVNVHVFVDEVEQIVSI